LYVDGISYPVGRQPKPTHMKKKILIGVGVLVILLAIAYAYVDYRNRSLSPPGQASLTAGDLTVAVTYSRPSVRGRLIFGTKEQKALQPYGEYWRLGANESTEVTFNKDVDFNGTPLKAGSYRLYAIPGEQEFEIIVNSELGKWGALEPDHAEDLFTTKVPVERIPSVEQYTITLKEANPGINIVFEWSDVRFVVPVK
jgi:hypothetical protein